MLLILWFLLFSVFSVPLWFIHKVFSNLKYIVVLGFTSEKSFEI